MTLVGFDPSFAIIFSSLGRLPACARLKSISAGLPLGPNIRRGHVNLNAFGFGRRYRLEPH